MKQRMIKFINICLGHILNTVIDKSVNYWSLIDENNKLCKLFLLKSIVMS